MRLNRRFLPALQWQRLVAQHPIDDHLARGVEIDAVALHQVGRVGDDRIDILLDLEILVMILLAEAHAFADDLENVDDLERPVAFVRAQLAVIGMIDRHQRVDPSGARGFELLQLQLKELEAARSAGVDALVAVYHSDHRELCAHERDWPFKIVNVLEIVGESMGLRQDDHYKNLKIKQDVDAIIADSADLLKRHGVDLDTARKVIVNGMLSDQPLPLQGKRDAVQVSR